MKYLLPIQLVVCTFLFFPASAQVEDWDTYVAMFGDKRGSVLIDMGLMTTAPDTRYPYLVVTGPRAQNCGKQGLPATEEISSLEEILDATNNFITGVTAKVLTGTLTYNCERLNYYYVKDTTGIRNALVRMYERGYKNYKYKITMRSDPEWTTYRTFLYPTETTQAWMENNRIITKLKQEGDSLTTPRTISFDLYFRSDTSRQAFADFARTKGYNADKLLTAKTTNAPYEIIVSKYGYVNMSAMDSCSRQLKAEAKKHNGFYNGWQAPKETKGQK